MAALAAGTSASAAAAAISSTVPSRRESRCSTCPQRVETLAVDFTVKHGVRVQDEGAQGVGCTFAVRGEGSCVREEKRLEELLERCASLLEVDTAEARKL